MTIQATPSEISYAADGVTVIFPVPFPFDTAADLKLTSTDVSGNILTLTTGFTISGGAGSTGNATFAVAPAVGLTITIYDNPALTQPTNYVSLDAFPAESHERALDRVTRIAKRLYQLIQRSVRFPDGDVSTDGVLGSVANRKGKYLFFNAVTGAIEYAANIVTTTLSQSVIGGLLNPQTTAELAAGITPTNLAYPPGNPWRYGADGLGGANDTTALARASTILATTGINGWRNGVPGGIFLRTAAEIAVSVFPTNYTYPLLDARRYGYAADNNTATAAANVTALNTAISVATATVSGASGATVLLPTGIGYVNTTIILPNRVRIRGVNCSGSIIKATAGFATAVSAWNSGTSYVVGNLASVAGTTYSCILAHTNHTPPNVTYWAPWTLAMFWAQNGVTATFDSILQDLFIDCSSVTGLAGVLTDAWQENSGLRSVTIFGFTTYGLRYRNVGAGGQATSEIQQVQMFAANVAGVSACIRVDQISSVGATLIHVRDSVLTGNAANPVAIGCDVANDSLLMDNVHFEGCVDGVQSGSGAGGGVGSITLHNLTGLAGMTSILHVLATFTGRINMNGCARNGATNLVKNDASGETYTSPDLADYVYPEVVTQNTLKAWCVFDGTTVGTNAPLKGYNVTSVTRNGAGDYTITYARALKDAVNCVNGNSVLSGTTPGTLSVVSTGQGSCRVNLTKSAALTDSSQVMVEVKGL